MIRNRLSFGISKGLLAAVKVAAVVALVAFAVGLTAMNVSFGISTGLVTVIEVVAVGLVVIWAVWLIFRKLTSDRST